MLNYILRRIIYAIPIIIAVNIITFVLFFIVNSPDDMASIHLGTKHVTKEDISNWKHDNGYDKPLFFNSDNQGFSKISNTMFYQKSILLLNFDFGSSDSGRNINQDIKQRMWPSLAIAIPSFIAALVINIVLAMVSITINNNYHIRNIIIFLTVVLMSISPLFYIIVGQMIFSEIWHFAPISGYQGGIEAYRFVALPIFISVLAGLGVGIRWYRSIILEEFNKPYVLSARARGLSETRILFKHILKNAMIPILTGVVVVIPSLFLGSLLIESFFSIPGLGSYTIDAISAQDFAIVRSMVFLGSVLYIIGLLLTDISYALVDPRINFK